VTLDDYQSIDSSIIAINPSANMNAPNSSGHTSSTQQRLPNLPQNLQFPFVDQWAAHNRFQQQQFTQPPMLQHLTPQAYMLPSPSNLFQYHQHHAQQQQQHQPQTTQNQHANPNMHFNDTAKNMKKI
jgi:hypothetical protein